MATTGYQAALDSNDLIMAYVPEVQWGVTPTASPAFKKIRLDGEGFSGSKSRTRPNEIDPSGQASAAITTKEESTGSLNFSVSAGTHNDLLAASLGDAFTTTGTIAGGTYSKADAGIVLLATTALATTISASSGNSCTIVVTTGAFGTIAAPSTGADVAVVANKRIQVGALGTADAAITATATTLNLTNCSWTPVDGSAGSIIISNAVKCTLNSATSLFTTTDIAIKGQLVKLSTPLNKGIARVATVSSATSLILDMCSFVPVTESAVTATLKGTMLRNGTTFQSFTFLKQLSALLNLRYAGSFPTGGSLGVGVGDYLKGTLAFLNKSEVSASDMTYFTTPTFAAAPTGTIVDSIKGIGTVWRGVDSGATAGAIKAIDGVVQKIDVKWNKEGAAAQYGIGSAAALGMRAGKQLISGSLSTYFRDFTLFAQYTAEQSGPISFYALDGLPNAAATKGYVITFCNATIMNPKVVAGGPGQDVMADFEIEGNPDVTTQYGGKTIQIDYFG